MVFEKFDKTAWEMGVKEIIMGRNKIQECIGWKVGNRVRTSF